MTVGSYSGQTSPAVFACKRERCQARSRLRSFAIIGQRRVLPGSSMLFRQEPVLADQVVSAAVRRQPHPGR